MSHLNFRPCLTDLDACTMPGAKLDGSKCYENVSLDSDDALMMNVNEDSTLRNDIEKMI